YEITAVSLDKLVDIKTAKIRLEVFPPNVTAAHLVLAERTIPNLKGDEGTLQIHFDAKSVPAEGIKVRVGAARGDPNGPELDVAQGTFAVTPLSPIIELKVGGAKGWKAGSWPFLLPLTSDDGRYAISPGIIPFL